MVPFLRILSGIFFVVMPIFDSLSLSFVQSLCCPLLNAQSEPSHVLETPDEVINNTASAAAALSNATPEPTDSQGTQENAQAFILKLELESRMAFHWFAHRWPAKGLSVQQLIEQEYLSAIADIKNRGTVIEVLEKEWSALSSTDTVARAKVFVKVALLRRNLRLKHMVETQPEFIFVKRDHWAPSFIAYTEGLSDARAEAHFTKNSQLCQLSCINNSVTTTGLLSDPNGMLRDPDVSYDGSKVLFAWKKSRYNDDYHLYELDRATGNIKQLTFGLGLADYEGAYLPDDTIVFSSSRPEQSVPCWQTEVSNIYKMNLDGSYLRRLAIDQVHAFYPKPTDDGRISYTRWDYNDRGQVYPHPLFQMKLDGSGQANLHGGSSWYPTSRLHARQIPGTSKFLFIASGHHTPQQGKVFELDPNLGNNEGEGVQMIAPVRDYKPEKVDVAMQWGDLFCYPYPLGNDEFLVSWRRDGVPPRGKQFKENSEKFKSHQLVFDLCWFDYSGAHELLAHDPTNHCLQAVGLNSRPKGLVKKSHVKPEQQTGQIYISNVYSGYAMKGVESGSAKTLRVVEILYRAAGRSGVPNRGKGGGADNFNPVSIGQGSWDVKSILGDTPIHPDGSVWVEIPAMKSIYYQVLNSNGEMIQTMRTWDTLQPGEIKSCVGCHDYNQQTAPPIQTHTSLALKTGIAKLQSPLFGTNGFSFPKEIQPILDQKCIQCHAGEKTNNYNLAATPVEEDGRAKRKWSPSYITLTQASLIKNANKPNEKTYWQGNPDGKWVKWIDKMSEPTVLPPYSSGSTQSPLLAFLRKGHYDVALTPIEFSKLSAWIDLLVPYCGDYYEANSWNDVEKAYYQYYEDKRRLNKDFEDQEIAQHVASLKNESADNAASKNVHWQLSRQGKILQTSNVTYSPSRNGTALKVRLSKGLKDGDLLEVQGLSFFYIQLSPLPMGEIYSPKENWKWVVPEQKHKVFPPELYTNEAIELTIIPLSDFQRSSYRNLAINPYASLDPENSSYPQITADSECRKSPWFSARCAIDGYEGNKSHGGYPHQSWGPEQAPENFIKLDVGRLVQVDRVDCILRADFPHDKTWNKGELWVDDRKVADLNFEDSGKNQFFSFKPVVGKVFEIRKLTRRSPGWAALSEMKLWGLDADRTPGALIESCKQMPR